MQEPFETSCGDPPKPSKYAAGTPKYAANTPKTGCGHHQNTPGTLQTGLGHLPTRYRSTADTQRVPPKHATGASQTCCVRTSLGILNPVLATKINKENCRNALGRAKNWHPSTPSGRLYKCPPNPLRLTPLTGEPGGVSSCLMVTKCNRPSSHNACTRHDEFAKRVRGGRTAPSHPLPSSALLNHFLYLPLRSICRARKKNPLHQCAG